MSGPGTDMPAMPLYARDWLTDEDVRDAPRAVRSDYMDLLLHQWMAGSLPADPERLRRRIGLTPKEWVVTWKWLERKFPVGEDGMRRNGRCERVRAESLELRNKRSAAGRKGNGVRWGNGSQGESQTASQSDRIAIATAIAKPSPSVAVEEESKDLDQTASTPPDRLRGCSDPPNGGPTPPRPPPRSVMAQALEPAESNGLQPIAPGDLAEIRARLNGLR